MTLPFFSTSQDASLAESFVEPEDDWQHAVLMDYINTMRDIAGEDGHAKVADPVAHAKACLDRNW